MRNPDSAQAVYSSKQSGIIISVQMAGIQSKDIEAMVNNPDLVEFLEAMIKKAKAATQTKQGSEYKWHVEDIYKWVVTSKQAKLKYKMSKEVFVKSESKSESNEENIDPTISLEPSVNVVSNASDEKEKMIDSFEHDQSVLVKGDFLCFDGMSKADKFLMEINNIDGIKEYQDEVCRKDFI
ncbi:hypothetical protein GOP47_0026561 [Adiantum capillus-veneris]|nr:hypothetical protein GOP47_0026561 [Adiantum capillus-veneris]